MICLNVRSIFSGSHFQLRWRCLANLLKERRSMDSAGFDATRWEHWLVIGCFVVMAAGGLWSSWQFKQAAKKRARQQQVRSRLARRLAMELRLPDESSVGSSGLKSARLRPRPTALLKEVSAAESMHRRDRSGR